MRIKTLQLNNFRNFTQAHIALNEGTTVFYGGVGQGKTNILEAMFMLTLGRSFRTAEAAQVISWGKSEAYVRGEGRSCAGELSIGIRVRKSGKYIELNGANNKRPVELIGGLRSVMFHADDVLIVSGAPHYRRRFLDLAISQSSATYLHNLREYYKIMKQRNSALMKPDRSGMDVWDEQLATTGSWLAGVRAKIVAELAPAAEKILRMLTGGDEKLEIRYLSSGGEDAQGFREKLIRTRGLDISRGLTSIGAHRDELRIMLDGVDARQFCSSGEKKSIVLAIKLAEVELIRSVTGERPAMLFDDLFSSLDEKRSKALMRMAGEGGQSVITLTDMGLIREIPGSAALYEVRRGEIRKAA